MSGCASAILKQAQSDSESDQTRQQMMNKNMHTSHDAARMSDIITRPSPQQNNEHTSIHAGDMRSRPGSVGNTRVI